MLYIGMAIGAFAVLVCIAAGMGCMFWSVAKDHEKDKNRLEEEQRRIREFWKEANAISRQRTEAVERIMMVMERTAKEIEG